MPKKSKKISPNRANERLVPPRRYRINRIAVKGSSELSHTYGELWAEDVVRDAPLGAVVEI
jgi:hypothetical protein